MTDESLHYAVEYTTRGRRFSMTMYGTYGEVWQHADNLGLLEPELVVAVIPVLSMGLH